MEQRKSPRFDVELPISFSGNEVAGGGLITGLSSEGCTVVSDAQMLSNTYLVLRIQLPDQYTSLRVDLAAVRWTTGEKFGLEFMHVRGQEHERLRKFIDAVAMRQKN
ncbi:MAG: PilZ domain-containing protein [Nitrospiraceae bacterium]